jgi:hypothetical protein
LSAVGYQQILPVSSRERIVERRKSSYVCQVAAGKEDLSYRLLELAEEIIPKSNESSLSDSSEGLLPTFPTNYRKRQPFILFTQLRFPPFGSASRSLLETDLLLAKALSSTLHPHPLETDSDSSRTDKDNPVAERFELADRLDDGGEEGEEGHVRVGIDDGGSTELNNDGEGGCRADMAWVEHGLRGKRSLFRGRRRRACRIVMI